MVMMVDTVEQKLDMSLEQIVEQRKAVAQPQHEQQQQQSVAANGKARNSKRSERLAQNGPYQPRSRSAEKGNQQHGEPGRRVYVGNLSWSVQSQDLNAHMAAAGDVVSAMVLESNGRSKGCGLVEFAHEDDAHRAIATLNDTELDGRKIFVREDREASTPSSTPQHSQVPQMNTSSSGGSGGVGTRVYVGNLSWAVKWQDLKDHMKSAGTVVRADVLEESNGRSKGCGLVEFSTPEEAQHAIATLTDTELEGRKIFVREDREPEGGVPSTSSHVRRSPAVARPPFAGNAGRAAPAQSSSVQEGTSLYIGNLSWEVSWQTLKDLFRSVGEVDRSEVAQFPDGRSSGFGIIRFVQPRDAARAIHQLNGAEFMGRAIEVRYDKGRS